MRKYTTALVIAATLAATAAAVPALYAEDNQSPSGDDAGRYDGR